jgi:hypothetical protein
MPTQKVQDYVNDVVRMGQVSSEAPFSILDVPLRSIWPTCTTNLLTRAVAV